MTKSKLNIFGGTGLIVILIPFVTFLFFGAVFKLYNEIIQDERLTSLWIIFWMTIVIPLLYLLELPKIKNFEIDDEEIRIKNPFTRNIKIYQLNDLDGFKTQIQSSKGGNYEIIYLIKNGIKIQEISSFHIKNFDEIKSKINDNLENLGFEQFKFFRYLKDGLKR